MKRTRRWHRRRAPILNAGELIFDRYMSAVRLVSALTSRMHYLSRFREVIASAVY
jgi:hypothetical protein